MQLLINTPGTLLTQRDGCFLLKKEERKAKFSPQRVTSIIVSNKASISTQAIVLAMEHNIDLMILDQYGDPVGRFWYGKPGRSVFLRRLQIEWAETSSGLAFGLEWLATKLHHQLNFLKKLKSARPKQEKLFVDALSRVEEAEQKLQQLLLGLQQDTDSPRVQCKEAKPQTSLSQIRATAMGLEGTAAKAYFATISSLLPKEFQFHGRSRRPAKDPFNATLNYAYGILYGRVERACLLAGLDPYTGFLHAEHPYRPALVCDLIEPFRCWADRTVTYLFTGRKMQTDFFDVGEHGCTLEKACKELLVSSLQKHLEERVRVHRRHVERGSLMLHEAHLLANKLLTGGETSSNWQLEQREF